MDRVASFFSERTPRRLLALTAFITVLYIFRHLALLLVFFVTFERALGFASRKLSGVTGVARKRCVLLVLAAVLLLLGIGAALGVGKTLRTYAEMEASYPERIAELKTHPLLHKLQEQVGGTERIVEGAKHYAGNAISAASAVGHFFVYVLIGFVLALVYVLEEDEILAFHKKMDPRSLHGTMVRWFGHVADATVVTVQLQIIVAACNTLMTLPVLLLIGVPHIGALMILIFFSALVPVIGNIVSGAVLCLLAYQARGWGGVGIFIGLTFVLHKVESYYLNPRLTARHVKLPGFVLIVSLLACEHLFGFKGLFLSFPILFIAARIRAEFVEETEGKADSPIVLGDGLEQLPIERSSLGEEDA
jgi:predicted PurR-regulated permease PerM